MSRADEARSYLLPLEEDVAQRSVEADTGVAHGLTVRKILESPKDGKADLIGNSSHGRTDLARIFRGNVAVGVPHGADHPLLLVRSLETG